MTELQVELRGSLESLLKEMSGKLKPDEKAEISDQIEQIDELVERLKSGRIWLAIFGKTSVGKSAVVNALLGADEAEVGVKHDLTTKPTPYELGSGDESPYIIVDVPGVMGDPDLETLATIEAQKAHGCIFVIDGEPYQDELDIFDMVLQAAPQNPRIVFCNKYDRLMQMPPADRETVMAAVRQKMSKYVASEDDIVFGSAQLFDGAETMVRQQLRGLEDRLYDSAGTLGQIMNVFDPANRAESALGEAREKIVTMRRSVARKVIRGYAIAEAASSAVPFSDVVATPGLLFALTRSVSKIMGSDPSIEARRVTMDVLMICAQVLTATFVFATVAGTLADALGPIGWFASFAGLAALKYQRTLVFGEALLIYMENGFSFGADKKAMIARAKERAQIHYKKFRERDS